MKTIFFLFLILFVNSCSLQIKNKQKEIIFNNKLKIQNLLYKNHKALVQVKDFLKYGSGKLSYNKFKKVKTVPLNYDQIPKSRYYKKNDSKHTIYALIDLSCSYSKSAFYKLNDIVNSAPNRINLVYLLFPMDPSCNSRLSKKMKKNNISCIASKIALCAERDGLFFETVKQIYDDKNNINNLKAKYNKCLKRNYPKNILKKEILLSSQIKFKGLPYVLLDKKPIGRLYNAKKHFFMLLNYIDNVQYK